MKESEHKKVTGMDFMWLSLTAFLGLGMEALLAFGLEPIIWGVPMQEWSTGANIMHWVLTCIIWGGFAFWIIQKSKKECGFDPFVPSEKPEKWQWAATALCIAVCLLSTWIDWNGSKVLKEFQYNGALKFVFQYIYYFFEVVLVTLIIVYGQKAFEAWFKRPNIPYGAIVVALTWGLAHWWTKGSLLTGIYTALGGFCFGVVYLLLKRNIKLTYGALCIMFIL